MKIRLSIIIALFTFILATALLSCKKNGVGETKKIVVDSITLHNTTTTTTRITEVRIGAFMRINGSGFSTTNAVYLNGVKATVNPNYVTEHNIILKVPSDLPYGSDVTDAAIRNTIRIVTKYDDYTYRFPLLGPSPAINDISHSLPKAGEKLEIYGTSFRDLDTVALPGDIVFTPGEFQVASDYTKITVTVPQAATATPGSIYVHGANGAAYSYNYMNRKECVFIQKFTGDAAVTGGTGDCYQRAYNFGTNISANETALLPASGDGHKNPETYRHFPPTPSDAAIDQTMGSFDFRTCPAVTSVLQTSNGAVTAATLCNNLAVQFDIYMPVEWSSGFIRIELIKGNAEYRYNYAPWAIEGNVVPVKMNGWRTVTIPLRAMKGLNGKSFQYLMDLAPGKGGYFAFINGIYRDASGKAMLPGIINNFQLSFCNFRIVPYVKTK